MKQNNDTSSVVGTFEVVPDDQGAWVVRRTGLTEVLFRALQKQDAMNHALQLAKPSDEGVAVREKVGQPPLVHRKGDEQTDWKKASESGQGKVV